MKDFIFKLFCPHRYRYSWLMVINNHSQSFSIINNPIYIKKYKECSRCKKLYENKDFDKQLELVINNNFYDPFGEIKWGLIKPINFNYKHIYNYIDLKEYKRDIILNELLE